MGIILIAPMLAVFLVDESCLRYYTKFAADLKSLLDAWGLGQVGAEAFRKGFCSRRLISEFGYVWVDMAVISAFVNPTIWLLSEHPKVLPLLDWAGRKVADIKGRLKCIDQPQDKASD